MICNVEDFCADNPKYAERPSYADVAILKAYQEGKLEDDEASHEAEFVCDVVGLMTKLRYEAELNFRDGRTQANNRRGELCLTDNSLKERLTSDNDAEPPQQLISVIANQHLVLIENLVHFMRKVLRRKRDMVPISDVQQVDAHCLRWLARQPGNFAQEKAGARQKLMAVVREETKNTLENRVLKDFILRAEILSRRYLQQYEKLYPHSDRIRTVKRLRSCLVNALKLPEIQNVPAIKFLVQPNYVLLHDARYSKLWEQYRLVLSHARMSEIVWPKRHKLFVEIFCMWVITRLSLDYKSFFEVAYWIKEMPSQGCFLVNPSFTNAFDDSKGGVLSCVAPTPFGKLEIKSSTRRKLVQLLYVPHAFSVELCLPNNGVTYVVCCFSEKCCIRTAHRSDVVWVKSLAQIDGAVSEVLKGM